VFEFTAVHRGLLQQMVVVWDPTESGAPTVDPAAPYGSSNPWKDVQRVAEKHGMKAPKAEAMRLHRETESALGVLLALGTLPAGRYELADPLAGRKSAFAGISLVDRAESAIAGELRTHPPHQRGRMLRFEFRDEHRQALQAMSLEWREWSEDDDDWIDGPAIDAKRPYGNLTFFFLELARAIGLSPARPTTRDDHGLSHDQIRRLGRLHHEMDLALQVFLRQAELPLGRYAPTPEAEKPWTRVEPAR
jgi:hypothetical protein